tara:strand:+ start:6035 stop:6472 length:438 start_codon:yes stop_codon:yes gene_type:complete
MTSDWEYELGLVKVKTKEIWELEGRCGDECCYQSPSASQIAKRVQANHTVKYWVDFYNKQLEDLVIREAFGYLVFIDGVADGDLMDNPTCPYQAARRYKQSEGLLRAIYDAFGMGGVDKAIKQLRSSYYCDKNSGCMPEFQFPLL